MSSKEFCDDERNELISLISLSPELLAEICENVAPRDLYNLSTVCRKLRRFLWSSSQFTQQIWRNSRLRFSSQSSNPFDTEIMSEQQFIWLKLLGDSCQFCGVKIKENRNRHLTWEFKVLSCPDCLEKKTSRYDFLSFSTPFFIQSLARCKRACANMLLVSFAFFF